MEYSHLFLAFIQVFGERLVTLLVVLFLNHFILKELVV